MLGRGYPDENCSIARALEVFGERWSLLILRDSVLRGMTRYSQFQQSLNIASNVLADRLAHFVQQGLLDVLDDGTYRPTVKALEIVPTLLALTEWGDSWVSPQGAPIIYRNADGARLQVRITDQQGRVQDVHDPISPHPGPGASAHQSGRIE